MNHQQIAYLCGYFTRRNDIYHEQLLKQGWQRELLAADKIEGSKRVFYPEFVDFCYGGEAGCTAYTLPLNKQLTLEFRGQHYDYQLLELALYLMPQQMVLFSVKISQEADDLNAFTATLFSLRAIDYYTPDVHQSFIDTAINPLKTAYQQLTGSMPDSLSSLVENGNKLRVYQVINTTDATRIRKTDPGHPDVCAVYAYQGFFNKAEQPQICADCKAGAIGCGQCKKRLTECINDFLEPMRERRAKYEAQPALLDEIIDAGNTAARKTACETMGMVREAMKI